MPTYQYVCTECSTPLEVQQAFSDDPVTQCPTCPGRLRKVFSAVGVVFKGSGFYRNDSRPAESVGADRGSEKGAEKGADKGTEKPKEKVGEKIADKVPASKEPGTKSGGTQSSGSKTESAA